MPEMTKEEFAWSIRDNRKQATLDKRRAERKAAADKKLAERKAALDKKLAERKAALDKKLAEKKAKQIARGTESRRRKMSGLRGGGKVEMGYKKGGSVKAKSIDGIAQRGKTRGTMR